MVATVAMAASCAVVQNACASGYWSQTLNQASSVKLNWSSRHQPSATSLGGRIEVTTMPRIGITQIVAMTPTTHTVHCGTRPIIWHLPYAG